MSKKQQKHINMFDTDAWDDSLLIAAYDDAVRAYNDPNLPRSLTETMQRAAQAAMNADAKLAEKKEEAEEVDDDDDDDEEEEEEGEDEREARRPIGKRRRRRKRRRVDVAATTTTATTTTMTVAAPMLPPAVPADDSQQALNALLMAWYEAGVRMGAYQCALRHGHRQ